LIQIRLSCAIAEMLKIAKITFASIVRENVCNISKNVKSHVFGFPKKRKNVKKRNQLFMQPLITQLPEIGTG